ncbi:MAG: hypothetical protein WC997_07270 [Porticoccaceae bacterium]
MVVIAVSCIERNYARLNEGIQWAVDTSGIGEEGARRYIAIKENGVFCHGYGRFCAVLAISVLWDCKSGRWLNYSGERARRWFILLIGMLKNVEKTSLVCFINRDVNIY